MKQIGNLLPEIEGDDLVDKGGFEAFYRDYPRKTDKKAAERAWDKLSEKDRLAAYAGMVYHRDNNPQWQDKSLIPHPSTFLNGRRWEDEIVLPRREEAIEDVSDICAMVWSACTQMFGQSWINKHGSKASPVWRRQLEHLKQRDIQRGLRALMELGQDNPPSLPRFVELCRNRNYLPEYQSLPRPDSDPAIADAAFAELRATLNIR